MKVLSIEQMNRLKELGVDVTPKEECLMYSSVGSDDYKLIYGQSVCEDDMKAFTLQDVIELLPAEIETIESNYYLTITKYFYNSYVVCYFIENQDDSYSFIYFECETILDAAYQMLLWVIENGYLKTKVDDVQL